MRQRMHAALIGVLVALCSFGARAATVTPGSDVTSADFGPAGVDSDYKIKQSQGREIHTTYPAGTTSEARGGDSVTTTYSDYCGNVANGIPCLDSATKISTSVLPTGVVISACATAGSLLKQSGACSQTTDNGSQVAVGTPTVAGGELINVAGSHRIEGVGDGSATVRKALVVGNGTSGIYGQISLSQNITGNYYVAGVYGFHGLEDHNTIDMTGSINAYASLAISPHISGSSAYDHFKALQAWPYYSSSGNMTYFYGADIYNSHTGTGVITNNYGLHVWTPAGTGPITNNYGIYLDDQSRGTNNWAIYSLGAAKSYLGGHLGVGTAPDGSASLASTGFFVFTDSQLRVGDAGVISGGGATAHSQMDYYNGKSLTFSESGTARLKLDSTGARFYSHVGVGVAPDSTASLASLGYLLFTDSQLKLGDAGVIAGGSATAHSKLDYYTGKSLTVSESGDLRLTIDNSSAAFARPIRISGSASGYVGFSAPASVASYALTWPAASANGYLKNIGGTLSFASPTVGDILPCTVSGADISCTGKLTLSNAGKYFFAGSSQSSFGDASGILMGGSGADTAVTSYSAGNLVLGTGATAQMSINNVGLLNMGIGGYGKPKIWIYDDGTYVSGFGAYAPDTLRVFGDSYNKKISFGYQTRAGVFTQGADITDGTLTLANGINLNGSTSGTVTHGVAATTASYSLLDPSTAPNSAGQAIVYPSGGGQGTWVTPLAGILTTTRIPVATSTSTSTATSTSTLLADGYLEQFTNDGSVVGDVGTFVQPHTDNLVELGQGSGGFTPHRFLKAHFSSFVEASNIDSGGNTTGHAASDLIASTAIGASGGDYAWAYRTGTNTTTDTATGTSTSCPLNRNCTMVRTSTTTATATVTNSVNGHAISGNPYLTAADVGAVASNGAITGATKTRITYDAKGLVTAGSNATAADVGAVDIAEYRIKFIYNANLFSDYSVSVGSGFTTIISTNVNMSLGDITIAASVSGMGSNSGNDCVLAIAIDGGHTGVNGGYAQVRVPGNSAPITASLTAYASASSGTKAIALTMASASSGSCQINAVGGSYQSATMTIYQRGNN